MDELQVVPATQPGQGANENIAVPSRPPLTPLVVATDSSNPALAKPPLPSGTQAEIWRYRSKPRRSVPPKPARAVPSRSSEEGSVVAVGLPGMSVSVKVPSSGKPSIFIWMFEGPNVTSEVVNPAILVVSVKPANGAPLANVSPVKSHPLKETTL